MNDFFNTVLTNVSADITVYSALITIFTSLILGVLITFTYYKTCDEIMYQKSFAVTLLMLPVILSVIILFIGSNIARAFSLAGTLSIIRFRSAPGDPKDIAFIFFSIAAGLSCGVGFFGYGLLFVIILCAVIILLSKTNLFELNSTQKILKITIPEDLNYKGAFDDVLQKYTKSFKLSKIKTTDLGSLFEVVYVISTRNNMDEQEFLNELRCRNGNLNIILSAAPTSVN